MLFRSDPTLTTAEAELVGYELWCEYDTLRFTVSDLSIVSIWQARQTGILLYSIGIGPATDRLELERIAGDKQRVYYVDSYDDIAELKKQIGRDLSQCYNPDSE